MSIYDFTVNTLQGQPQSLAQFRGKVALVVNVASECGYTPQYSGLEELWVSYKDKGLVVMGFPCNQFGAQEPGTAEQIESFCQRNFGVTFPMFEKLDVRGENQSPIYRCLSADRGEPQWNFHKYLVGRDGEVLGSFSSKVAPASAELLEAIETALG